MEKQLIIGMNGYVISLDLTSGREHWRTKLDSGFFSATRSGNVSVLKRDDMILVGCNGHVFGLDARSGEKRWHNELPGAGHGDVSLSIEGVSVQYIEKIVESTLPIADGRPHTVK